MRNPLQPTIQFLGWAWALCLSFPYAFSGEVPKSDPISTSVIGESRVGNALSTGGVKEEIKGVPTLSSEEFGWEEKSDSAFVEPKASAVQDSVAIPSPRDSEPTPSVSPTYHSSNPDLSSARAIPRIPNGIARKERGHEADPPAQPAREGASGGWIFALEESPYSSQGGQGTNSPNTGSGDSPQARGDTLADTPAMSASEEGLSKSSISSSPIALATHDHGAPPLQISDFGIQRQESESTGAMERVRLEPNPFRFGDSMGVRADAEVDTITIPEIGPEPLLGGETEELALLSTVEAAATAKGAAQYVRGKRIMNLSLDDAAKKAAMDNLQIRYRQKQVEKADATVQKMKAVWFPVFSSSGYYTLTKMYQRKELIERRRQTFPEMGENKNNVKSAQLNGQNGTANNDIDDYGRIILDYWNDLDDDGVWDPDEEAWVSGQLNDQPCPNPGPADGPGDARGHANGSGILEPGEVSFIGGPGLLPDITVDGEKIASGGSTPFKDTEEWEFPSSLNRGQEWNFTLGIFQQIPWGPSLSLTAASYYADNLMYDEGFWNPLVWNWEWKRPWTSSLACQLNIPVPGSKNFGPWNPAGASIRLAQASKKVTEWEHRKTVNDTLFSLSLAYWDLVRAVKRLRVTTENRKNLETILGATKQLVEAQRATAYDQAQIQAEIFRICILEERAWQNVLQASNTLRELLDLDRDVLVLPRGYGLELANFLSVSLSQALSCAEKENPEIQSARSSQDYSKMNHRSASVQLRPQMDVVASLSYAQTGKSWTAAGGSSVFGYSTIAESWREMHRPDVENRYLGVSIEMPWGNNPARAKVRQAQAEVDQAEWILRQTEQAVAKKIKDALVTLASAREQIRIAKSRRDLAMQAYTDANTLLEAGRATVFEITRKLDELLKARYDLVDALVQNKIAEMQLLYAQGSFSRGAMPR